MSLSFANPIWLLAALAAVPLLAHLFSRTRPRRREFPSLVLLREALRRVTRVRRPQDRWLLILRTLAIAALVAAFLMPVLLSQFSGGGGKERTVVVIVDATASMGFADGTQMRLAQAATAAEDVLATLPAGSRANVIWLRAHAEPVLPEPGPNLDFLRQSLRQAVAYPEAGEPRAAFALALKQLSTVEGERELVVCSDFQKGAWKDFDWAVPSSVRVTRIAAGAGGVANTGLSGLVVEPARPVAGQDARLACRVRNFSGEPRRVTVFAEAGESRLSQSVEIAPWSETPVFLPVKFPAEGLVPLRASLAEDRFPGDDSCYALAEVRGALQIAIVGGAEDATAQAWDRVSRALDSVAVRRVSLDQPGVADVMLVASWNGEHAGKLAEHLQRGGALVLQPAPGLDPAAARALLGLAAAQGEAPLAADKRAEPGWSLRITAEDHAVFALFAGGAFGDPAAGRFRQRVAAPAFLAEKTVRTLLAFDDGRPALALLDVASGGGKKAPVAWWAMQFDGSDWPSRQAFVPFFGELVRHLALQTGGGLPRTFEPGDPLRFDVAGAIEPGDVRLVDERGKDVLLARESGARIGSAQPAGPGSFRWMAKDAILDRAVVNFPDSESDLRRLEAAELEKSGAIIEGAARARLAELREGRPLWPWCLAFAALCLLAEGVLLRRLQTRTPSTLPVEKKEKEMAGV